jgi:aspartate-semialdehyde dehydrogenase
MKKPVIAIVGATGAVGHELLRLIEERRFQFATLHLVASRRSAGRTIEFLGQTYSIQPLDDFDFRGVDLAFFSAGTSVSRDWAPRAAAQGALVIDNTNAFRMDGNSPLVVPQVNAAQLKVRPRSGIIANPNCSTIQMVRVLDLVDRLCGIRQVVVSTYQAVSGGGHTGILELRRDSMSHLRGDPVSGDKVGRFAKPIAFNVIPQIDVMLDDGSTLEERKMVQETRKILNKPDFQLTATAVRVPVINGHSEAVYIETHDAIDLPSLMAELKQGEELMVYEGHENYPTPAYLASANHVHVGRIRINPNNPRGIWCWIVADNLRIGAALNAIQIAERLGGKSYDNASS